MVPFGEASSSSASSSSTKKPKRKVECCFSLVSNAKPTKPVPPVRNALLFRVWFSSLLETLCFPNYTV
ncbi:hypothetical protein Goshw_021196, partial [Gossypium schwendimanii]|nr:hypothetical protein [Gossypium klotzschianum]MBA0868964.1 hypothetical protein [Gossypium schwendimanii]